ncbi:acetate--CoA ligase family protein [Pseudactinotalea sp. HY158]|uniref:acetate--CoA ligase family protein n=1 Tax=Pseudactinotalea sp. HY158 TaxID=2654547 RepID=UPI001E49DD9D|nr:acetate--CoA ligase family protein [Pseudactinotalea sp. HY158]
MLRIVPHLARLDTGALLVLTGGFATAGGEGTPQTDLLRLLRRSGIRLVGPRSVGVLARGESGALPALLYPGIMDDVARPGAPGASGIGLFCQSAHATRSLLDGAGRRRLTLSTVLSAGHRADVSGNDTMQFWTADPRTAVACVHLESMGNPRKFSRVARRLAQDRPVIVRVAGRSGQVRPPGHPVRTTRTPRRALEELMNQAGVLLADSVDQQLDWAMMFSTQPLPRGPRVAVVTNSGTQTAILAELLGSIGARPVPGVATLNPVAAADDYRRVLAGLAGRDDWDCALVGYGPFLDDDAERIAPAIAEFADRTGRLVLARVHGLSGLDPLLRHGDTSVPGFATGDDAVAALRAGLAYAERREAAPSPRVDPPGVDRRRALGLVRAGVSGLPPGELRRLDAERTAELLAAYGLPVLASRVARTEEEAVEAAEAVGWPVALKVADEALRHRTDLGGVRLDLASAGEVRHAFAVMASRLRRLGRGEREVAFEVQAMAEAGAACVLRAEEDPLYGPILSFGLAGDAVELLGDVSYRVPPLTEADVSSLITSVRAAPRLLGHRDLPALAVPALADVIARTSVLKEELAEIARVEFNPVLVTEREAVILSATVDLTLPGRGDTARRVLPG